MGELRQNLFGFLVPERHVNDPAKPTHIENLPCGNQRFTVKSNGFNMVIPARMLAKCTEVYPWRSTEDLGT